MDGRDALLALSLHFEGRWDDIYQAIRKKEKPDLEAAEEYKRGGNAPYITILDNDYPPVFKCLNKPPFIVFYRGNRALLKEDRRTISYVGSREASRYGLTMTKRIVEGLVDAGISICTGLARGIDAQAAETALDNGGKLICVLGNGIEYCYPSSSTPLYERAVKMGLVISEYPGRVAPSKENFPARNRLVAALGAGILLGEASKKSGTLITASYGLSLNKEVGCVPYNADVSSGCNMLIKDGAYMIESAEDALLMIGAKKETRQLEKISEAL